MDRSGLSWYNFKQKIIIMAIRLSRLKRQWNKVFDTDRQRRHGDYAVILSKFHNTGRDHRAAKRNILIIMPALWNEKKLGKN